MAEAADAKKRQAWWHPDVSRLLMWAVLIATASMSVNNALSLRSFDQRATDIQQLATDYRDSNRALIRQNDMITNANQMSIDAIRSELSILRGSLDSLRFSMAMRSEVALQLALLQDHVTALRNRLEVLERGR